MALEITSSPYNLSGDRLKTQYLYTKGNQFSLNGENYIGEYHKNGSKFYTGPIHNGSSKLLTKYYSDPLMYEYDRSRGFEERIRVVPNQIVWAPLDTNYKTGFATRYFVERTGNYESYPIEIDAEQKSMFGSEGGIDEGLYALAVFDWKLTGPERNVYKDNQLYIEGIYEFNQRQVIVNSKIIPNLEYAIKSYTEYARVTLS